MPASAMHPLSPYARVGIALTPFLAAVLLRLIFGHNRTTGVLISIGTAWFATIILLAPFSVELEREVNSLFSNLFR